MQLTTDAEMLRSETMPHSHLTHLFKPRRRSLGEGNPLMALVSDPNFWEEFYQQHEDARDWYLPNELVLEWLLDPKCSDIPAHLQALELSNTSTDAHASESSTDEISATKLTTTTIHNIHNNVTQISSQKSELADVKSVSDSSVSKASVSVSGPHVLHVGCGTSDIPFLMHNAGICDVINMDCSESAISIMNKFLEHCRKLHPDRNSTVVAAAAAAAAAVTQNAGSNSSSCSCPDIGMEYSPPSGFYGLSYEVADVLALQKHYQKHEFQFIVDKGTFDSVTALRKDGLRERNAKAMLNGLYHVLAGGGQIFIFSLHGPETHGDLFAAATDSDQHAIWSTKSYTIEHSPYEIPTQQHTYLHVLSKQ
jgi:hypothetical protein